jgi:RNA polymerase sigma-70 factor (ECF subfamily)
VTTDFARRRFNEMVLPHLDDAYGLARWLTGNRTDAEDVVQDACMRALASLETAVVERPRPWLLTIVRNTAFSWMGKNRPKAVVLVGDSEVFDALGAHRDTSPGPEDVLIAAADEAALESAILALPPIFREMVVMRDINGMSYREIAAATGAPQGTVMSRLARARAQLVDKLGRRT